MIPLISSGTAGPLGVLHLPRLWLKTLLSAVDQLPPGYKDIRVGFDFMVLEGLKIDPDAARSFIVNERPSYLGFEAWIKAQPGVDLTPANIAEVNAVVTTREKSDRARAEILATIGLPDDGTIKDSILLNALDDWHAVHAELTS
ncbi:DUF5069 domain-containing protein [Synoicihabitans lomoniglobus]|uniref:DUF5069 domain-containing protein n=1 Tax=Synoicihabitans lomoniglobus TaxID=2909285 RepID=A0AAF0CNP6_9BACT|nr:DUF5069 domain-containing protein [Opitutaceae bacterium LMO-M01]WED64791.1 DUF5069 domain-containing protein [Opitutaceae bacterium LMO-M01]